jgi:Ternary complex associated domain 9
MMNITDRLVNKTIDKILPILNSSIEGSNVFIDDSSEDLIDLADHIVNDIANNVLIRMTSKQSKENQPYADLLEQLIYKQSLGVSISIDTIVADLLNDKKSDDKENRIEDIKNFSRSPDLKVGDLEVDSIKNHNKVANSLLNWAQLESHLDTPRTSFSKLAGGIKPLIYVFDDYNNFIDKTEDKIYKINREISQEIEDYYKRSSSSQAVKLSDAVIGFCRCFNRLSLAFDVQAPDIKFQGNEANRYEIVANQLNFQKLDKERNQIAAFILDLEWLPDPEWIHNNPEDTRWEKRHKEEMGHIAIRLLTQRYPEIPCFIFTGMWTLEVLQQSLSAGAAWCFQKSISHHRQYLVNTSNLNEELNYFNLERHLTEFAMRTYGTYEQLPNPQQLDIKSNPDVVDKLSKKANLNFIGEGNNRAKGFRQLIAGQFTATKVNLTKVLTAGKSGALATFFAQPFDGNDQEATRFVKVDSWLDVQTEYLAYQNVIRPRLNNHVAHIIQKPSVVKIQTEPVSPNLSTSELIGSITSSLAGFPEDYNNLSTLQEIIDRYIDEPGGIELISKKINLTLEMVLLPLYQNSLKKEYWLEEEFSFRYQGDLISINKITNNESHVDHSRIGKITKLELIEVIEELDSKLEKKEIFCLRGWSLLRLFSGGELILYHPLIRSHMKISGDIKDLNRFNALWVKPGNKIDLVIKLDKEKSLFFEDKKKILEKSLITENNERRVFFSDDKSGKSVSSLNNIIDRWKESIAVYTEKDENLNFLDPFEIMLENKNIFNGHRSAIHGDLNLNNILYPEDENVGFLIDFAKTKKDGLIAYDFAFLEVRIWVRYLLPAILIRFSTDDKVIMSSGQILFLALELANGKSRGIHSKIVYNPSSPVYNALKIIDSIRRLIKHRLPQVTEEEHNYCLGVSFLKHAQYGGLDNVNEIADKINVMAFLVASYYLSKMPTD